MKKLFIAFVAVAAFGLVSCSKCVECTKEGQQTAELCEKDAESTEEYDLAVATLESGGYTCSNK